jgi:hypothetical protein
VGETDYSTALPGSDLEGRPTLERGKFKFGGQVRETDYCTAHAGSDPNYLGKASMEGNAVVRCEFGHVGDGRRADSSTRFPGASSFFYYTGRVLLLCGIDLVFDLHN